ncbi:MAG: GDSL-type esterase/lipase family protein, partial [Chryseobacterium sp.]|nr:GDSL-type esterase/lipase family protein [Chryseobacterium sp.]
LLKKSFYLGALSLLIVGSQSYASNLTNYNEPNTQLLKNAFNKKSIHIVQFGDSHTAADVMTGTLRTQLQDQLGNGGMGWGMPMYFTGQRLALYGYDNNGWQPISSRQHRDNNYTLGGLIAVPKFSGATLTIKAKQTELPQRIMVNLRQSASDGRFIGKDAKGQHIEFEAPVKNNTWQTVEFVAQLPFSITASNAEHSAIGGWWAKNENGNGAVVSALGINGAELSFWNRWNEGWQQNLKIVSPDLIILAYGTNEAFNDNIDVENYKNSLISKIKQIRVASPNTALMIVSAPESLKNMSGQCGTRPIKLTSVQNIQHQVAQEQHTLFWDWQRAMGEIVQ